MSQAKATMSSSNPKSSERAGAATTTATNRSSHIASKRSMMFGSHRTGRGTTLRSGRSARTKDPLRVIMNGVDVTPLPLIENKAKAKKKSSSNKSLSSRRAKGGSSMMVSDSIASSGIPTNSSNATSIREGSNTIGIESGLSLSSIASDSSEIVSDDGRSEIAVGQSEDDQSSGNERDDGDGDQALLENSSPLAEREAVTEPIHEQPVVLEYSPIELNQLLEIRLSESATHTLLNQPSICIWSKQADLAAKVEKEAQAYQQRLASRPTTSKRCAQTFNLPLKTKEVQAQPPSKYNVGCQSSKWDIYDRFAVDPDQAKSADSQSLLTEDAQGYEPRFLKALTVVEKALIQNEIHDKHLLYRNREPVAVSPPVAKQPLERRSSTLQGKLSETDTTGGEQVLGGLERLWTFGCKAVSDFCVNAMDWNRVNLDLLAAGYGPAEFGDSVKFDIGADTGLVALWTLKNPECPSRLIRSKIGITSLDFSSEHPQLLAVGLYDGSLSIYDIRKPGDSPILKASSGAHSHSDPVWGVKWTSKGTQGSEHIMSVSTDGHIKQWSMKKGLVAHDVMVLKRITNPQSLTGDTGEGMINRIGSSLCFDFSRVDSTLYLTGTEDGVIHKCSKSYNEQVIESYFGHTGPINRLKISPFLDKAFVSASTDCTVRVWTQKSTQPALTLQCGYDYIMDVDWSPNDSCVFASVSRDGRLDVWNIESSTVNPWVTHSTDPGRMLNSVLFGVNAPVIMAGARDGKIDAFRLYGLTSGGNIEDHQLRFSSALASQS